MRKLVRALAFLCLAAAGLPASAQLIRDYFASDYGQWMVPSQAANTYIFNSPALCNFPQPAATSTFFAFYTNAPVWIVDPVAANSELVTPSAVTNNNAACGPTIAPVNVHYSFRLISGTGGLQEVLNQIAATTAYPVPVYLDRNWYTLMSGVTSSSPAAAINSVTGNAQVYLIDRTTVPWTYYSWNGTHYTPSASNVTAPTLAAGAGAGTGPTIALTAGSTGLAGYVTLTTGTTPTASAAVFTLTWPAIASGGFQYAPACVLTSIGTRAYTGTNAAVAGPPAVDTYTATATALTASVSGYSWKYSCH